MSKPFWIKYINIPVEVFGNEKLDRNDILLYGFIYLMDKNNYCICSNLYFSKILNLSVTSISTSISKLEKEGYIFKEIKHGNKRLLKTNNGIYETHSQYLEGINKRIEEMDETPLNNFKAPLKENLKDPLNKFKDINNTINIKKEKYSSKEEYKDSDESLIQPHLILKRRNKPKQTLREVLSEKIKNRTEQANKLYKEQKKEKPLLTPLPINKEIQEIFDLWTLAGFSLPKDTTKSHRENVLSCRRLLRGAIQGIPQFPGIDKIKKSIENYRLAAFEPEYWPEDEAAKKRMQKTPLYEFIFNSYARVDLSALKKYMESEPSLLQKHQNKVQDLWPAGTLQIMKFYRENARGTLKESFTVQEIDKFRKSANMCKEFWEKHQNRIRGITGYKPIANYLCEAVWEACGRNPSNIYPGSFCSDFAKDRLMAALTAEGLIAESDTGGTNIYARPVYESVTEEDIQNFERMSM